MKVGIKAILSDSHVAANQASSQRQLEIELIAITDSEGYYLPINLCLVLDYSGSMKGAPLETVKEAAIALVEKLGPEDRLSIIAFNHQTKVLVDNQPVNDLATIEHKIRQLEAQGGTAIDEGLKLGMKTSAEGKQGRVSQLFLLTDGENEHGSNDKCLKLAQLASEYGITVNTLGFGSHWNQEVLEKIADLAGGILSYIAEPNQALLEFNRLFERAQSVSLTNAHLLISLDPRARLAELKPVAQVSPETIELSLQEQDGKFLVRLGDLMKDLAKTILVNLYLQKLEVGEITIAKVQVRYDDLAAGKQNLLSEEIPVMATIENNYQPQQDAKVEKSILALAKYRQTQLAEQKLAEGDRTGAATLLQTAAKTALQLGDREAATVLQSSATVLQSGQDLSEAERKQNKIASKTILH